MQQQTDKFDMPLFTIFHAEKLMCLRNSFFLPDADTQNDALGVRIPRLRARPRLRSTLRNLPAQSSLLAFCLNKDERCIVQAGERARGPCFVSFRFRLDNIHWSSIGIFLTEVVKRSRLRLPPVRPGVMHSNVIVSRRDARLCILSEIGQKTLSDGRFDVTLSCLWPQTRSSMTFVDLCKSCWICVKQAVFFGVESVSGLRNTVGTQRTIAFAQDLLSNFCVWHLTCCLFQM